MMARDVEDLMLLHKRVIENLEEFSMSAEQQIEKLKRFDVADELASDFSDIALEYAKILFDQDWLTEEQLKLFLEIDKKLDKMSMNKDLWSNEAVKSNNEWEECRTRGKELLATFGY
ncbi:hypothetical protein HB897_07805 [Listeria seeligeri]|uniref:Uncharacterized protein n=2 Tax=Listeria seeligeri TaxID=1640 RepID=A0A7X0X1X9_LISSE|nr:hypothetical protein [Listeria seeligeri]MBC1884855.1 hypothetical protein [Listeria seeligeri]